ncbi:hypothetical protein GGG16DRAFT_119658, partial [Schizophyllum commune]
FSDRAKDTLKVSGAKDTLKVSGAQDTLKVSGAQVSPREIEEVVLAWRGEGLEPDIDGNAPSPGAAAPPFASSTPTHTREDASSGLRVLDTSSNIRVLDTSTTPSVLDVAVAGVRGHGRTADERVPRAWVVLGGEGGVGGEGEGEDTTAIIRALHTWTRARLSRHKWLRGGIEVVGEIPKNPTGKVLRRVLVERYERGLEDGRNVRAKL